MKEYEHIYMAIDLKSFYASVECQERALNPLTTNLVVADESRTEKTICLAVSPSLKQYGIPGRARLFEVIQKVKEVNAARRMKAPNHQFTGSSYDDVALEKNPDLEVGYLVAPPRMQYYMDYSQKIYEIYLQWFSADDIYVYSIDEVFIDVAKYLHTYQLSPRELATKVIQTVLEKTGITATCGIGTNLYLSKVAMDIVAKHVEPDENGVRIAGLDEMAYRKFLWSHQPLRDFWRVGKGIANKLEKYGMHTMGDIARKSIEEEELLYHLFGVNAELLIDHAWGYEPSTIESIKTYRPASTSLSEGQVLSRPYEYEEAKLIVKEMTENLSLNLVRKSWKTKKIVLEIIYDASSLTANNENKNAFATEHDAYGRLIPQHAHGTFSFEESTSSTKRMVEGAMVLFRKIVNRKFFIKKIHITAIEVMTEEEIQNLLLFEQMDLWKNYQAREVRKQQEQRENQLQKAVIHIKDRFGKNAVLKGMNFVEASTARMRNGQIGGHKS